MKKPTIIETFLVEIDDLMDLYIITIEEILGKYPEDGYKYFIEKIDKDSNYYWTEGDPVNIDRLITHLQNMKDDHGATHVRIYQHGDHHGYYLTGVKFEVADDERSKIYADKKTR